MSLIYKKMVIIFVLALITVAWGPLRNDASGADIKKGTRKASCNSLEQKDIRDILGKLKVPDSAIVSIAPSPVKGICEIVVDNQGRTGIFYLDLSKKYMFLFGSLVDVATMTNLTANKMQQVKDKKRVDIAKIPLNEALVAGDLTASKKVIVFTDPDCDYCAQLHKTIQGILSKRKDIAFYLKFLPLEFHKDAFWKAKSIVCNKSLQMLEDNFAAKTIQKTDCPTDEVDNSIKLANSLGIHATPTIILPDGRIREGAIPEDELLNLIDGQN
jgi:thiol:disulfide interchange protein DsbC